MKSKKELYNFLLQDCQAYLPPMDSTIFTVDRVKFEKMIKDAVKARKERLEEKHNLNVEMRPEFAQALQNCMSFSSK